MLIDNEDELKKKKEEARQLRNSFGMVTDNDKKIYGNDNFSFSDSTSSISNKHDSEDFSTTQNNSYSQRLEEAKKIRNSFGMTTTKDSGNDDFMNFSKDDDTITTIHQKDDNNISGTPKYYDTNIDNIEKTANTDTSINENTETQGESKTKKTDNNPSITRKVDQPSYKNISLSVANPEQTKNAKPIVDYTLQQQKEEKDSQNIFVKAGTWIKDLFGSIGVSIKNTATGLYKTAKEGYDERKEAVDNMSESDIQNSSNKNKILADTIAPNTFLTNTNNNENLNFQKTKLIINDTIQDVSRSTANGLIGIANNVLNFLTFGTLSKDTIKKIPDFSVLQNSEQYGEYSSQEELTNSIQNDKKQDLADYGLYNPSANAVADITVDIAEFLLLKKAGLGSTSAMVTSGTANTLGETGNVEDATKSAVSNYVFSKVLDNKLINEKLGNAVFNGTKGKVVEALGKHGELLDADTQMKIVKGLSSASATFSETFVSRILTNELQAVGDYGNDVYNKDVQKNILVDGVIWSAIYAGISGFSGAYAKVDVEQSNINDAEAKKQLETCYSIMELDSSKEYTIEELNKQRKELVKKYHPDLAGGNNEKMAIINNAYDVLNKYITEGVIDKVVIHTESSNTPPKEDNIKEKQNGMVVTKDGQIYVDSNDILKQTATNIAKSQISPAITTIVDKDNNLTGLEQVNVVPFEVENSKVPTITPAIYVSDDGSINVIDTNTGTKLLTNAKDADTAIETVTKALQSNDESNIRNIENEVTKNSIQVEQAIGNIIDKINEKTGENNAPDISQENQDDYFSSTFGNMPDINEDSSENSFYSSPTSYIPQEQSTNNDDIRYMKKSRASAQSKLQETDNNGRELSKQQQEYFKNSKIRDDKGNLLTLYHGSKNDFTIFDISESGKSNKNAKVGFWFTTSQEGANNFANSVWYGKNENSKAYEIYLNVTNPKIYEPIDNQKSLDNMNKKLHDLSELIRKAENKNIFLEIEKNRIKYASDDELNYIVKKYYSKEQEQQKFLEDIKQYKDLINKYKATEKKYDNAKYNDSYEQFRTDIYKYANKEAADANFGGTGMYLENENEVLKKYRDNLIKQGYDGIIIKNTTYDSKTMGKNNTQYVAFYPEQIKNVDNTSPTNNVDIRYLKSLTSQDSVSKINVNNIPKAVDTELGKTNAEREDSYIEKEIQKVESKGNWDNSIPVTKLSDINKTIEDYLQLKIKKGRFRQDAYGIYKDKRDVLRVQEYKDIDTALHEAGHAMDLGKRINVDKESISEELLNAIDKYGGYEGEPRSIKLDEGFAEVIREYGIKPEEAKKDYPNTIAILENMRMQDKSFDDFISKVQEMTYNYIHQSPRNRILSNLSVGEQTDKKIWNKKTIKTEIMRNVFDSDYALKVAVSDLAKASGKKVSDIKATENAYTLTRLASGIGERVTSILADGLIDENGEKRFEGLNKIGDILGKNPERYNDLRAYLVAQRDTEYKARTLRTGIRSMDSQSVINQFKNDSQIKEASKTIYNALDGVLQYAVDNHLLTSENAEALRESNAFYVPMQRVLENDRGNNVGNRGRVNDIIKKRTGSELDVKDVLENIISNSSNIIRQVENNNVLKALYKQGEESGLTGAVYDVIPAPMFKVGTQTLATWEKELKRQGVNTENLDLQKSIDIFSPSNKVDSKNLITSFIDDNGKRKYLQFYDEDVFNNLMGMDRKFMSKILSISSKLNMPLRFGATMGNIGFAIPNMISDTAQAAVYSTAGFIPVVDNAIGVLNILAVENKHVEKFLNQIAPEYTKKVNFMYELYKQSGAPSSTRLSQYRKSTQSIMNEIYGTKSSTLGIKESFKPLKRTLDMLSYIPDISEQSTRFRVYQKNYNYYKRKGNSEMDSRIMAAIESRDATQDFGRTGNITKEVNQAIPFSAARIGSSYTFAEKVSDNPKKVGFRIAMLTATALAISAMGYNSTKIQELNQRKKDDNFVFDIGDNVITIKKPQGVLRSIINLAEYIQDLATGHIEEGKEGERLGTWLNNAIMDNMPANEVTGLVPNAVAPLIENAINKDFYYNTDIVKSYDLDLSESEQYYDYNSQLSKWIGSIFNYSPAKIDNLISGYFGGLGTSVTNTIDYVLGKMGVIPEQAEMGAERNSVGKRFFVNVNSNSKSLDELYNTKDELTKKKNGGTITSEETKQLEKINEASSQIADINKKIKSIKSDEYLDGQEKAEKIKALQSERTDTARQALGKELMDTSNKTRIESTKFYPSNSTLKQNKYTLTLTDEMKNEYERIAYERYSQYSGQGLYNEDYLQKLETKCKDYAKNYMMQKYKSQLVKSK